MSATAPALIIVAPNFRMAELYARRHTIPRQTFIFPYDHASYAGRANLTAVIVTGDLNGTFDWTAEGYAMREDVVTHAELYKLTIRYRTMEQAP